ncbi:MAG: hypothetical protein IKD04_06045 [Clostridia bacterium]|nr:hypothetical protein [Clostridia bacterium]
MKFLKAFSVKKLFYNKRFTVPFSILAAFALWVVISVNQKPTMSRTFTDIAVSVNLEKTFAAENNMSIIGDISEQKFTVTVRGPSYLVSSLLPSNISLYASAAEVDAPGEYKLQVAAANTSSEYEILSISPPTLNLSFDYIETKEFTIAASAVGVTAAEGLIAEPGVVSGTENDTVTITGPRTVVNKIETVVAEAEVNKTLNSSETFDASIALYDEKGDKVDTAHLTLSASNIKVTVPISKKKTVPVKVVFSNMPSSFKASTLKTVVDHSTVTVIGTPETIDKVSEISLSPIDITTVSPSAVSFDVSAKLPDGVRLLDNIDHFTVVADVKDYVEKTLTVTSISKTGLGSKLTAKTENSIVNVKVCGPKASVSKLKASDVYALLDLTDKSTGEHTVNAAINFKKYTDVWAVGTYNTTVTIK